MTPDRHLGSAWIDKCRPDILITGTGFPKKRPFLINHRPEVEGWGFSKKQRPFFLFEKRVIIWKIWFQTFRKLAFLKKLLQSACLVFRDHLIRCEIFYSLLSPLPNYIFLPTSPSYSFNKPLKISRCGTMLLVSCILGCQGVWQVVREEVVDKGWSLI